MDAIDRVGHRMDRKGGRLSVEYDDTFKATVQHELQRCRREALLQAVANPHPETTDLADVGLGDWLKDLPDENDLVDLSTGPPVRWTDGRGWVEDPA